MKKSEVFYVVSALRTDSHGERTRYTTEEEAIDRAKEVCRKNQLLGRDMTFYILKVVASVEIDSPPLKVKRPK